MLPGTNQNPIIDSRYFDNSSGFLIGQRRLKELNDNVKHIDKTTEEILTILRGELKQQAAETKVVLNSIDDILKKISAKATIRASNQSQAANNIANPGNSNTQNGQTGPSNPLGRRTTRITRTGNNGGQDTPESQSDTAEQATGRRRNSKGQFESDGASNPGSGIRGLTRAIRAGFEMVNAPDTRSLDPTVEAMHEISQLISPAGRAFKAMGKGAMWLFGRRKPKDEALPKEQAKHNRTNERQMERLIDAIRRRGSSALGGLGAGLGTIGGFFGRGAKGMGKYGLKALRFLKRAPVIGSIIGAATLGFDLYNSKNAEDRGRAIGKFGGGVGGAAAGAVIGTAIFPGVGTAVGAVLGGVLGSTVGETIGGKFGEWTKKLIEADLPGRLMGTWTTFTTDLSKYFKNKKDQVIGEALDARDATFNLIDRGRAWFGDKEAQQRVEFNKKYGHSNVPTVSGPSKKTRTTRKDVLEKAAITAQNWNAGNIDGLSDEGTRRLVGSTVATESHGGDLDVVNKQGYMGRYQAGASWLADAGLIKGGSDAVKAGMKGYKREWDWAKAGGMTAFLKNKDNWVDGLSYEKYLSDASIQDSAFQKVTSKSYQQLLAKGALRGKGENEIAGLLKSAHIGGLTGAIAVSKGGTGKADVNGTTPRDYFNDIVENRDGLTGKGKAYSRITTQPTKAVGMSQPVIPQPAKLPKVQEMPTINKQIGSKPPQVVQIAGNADNIGQNVSDRQIAHAVTGGLGMRSYD